MRPIWQVLEKCRRLAGYTRGILVYTYGDIEVGCNFEAMMEMEKAHKEHFARRVSIRKNLAASRIKWPIQSCFQPGSE